MIDAAGAATELRRIPQKLFKIAGSRTGILGLTTVANLVVRTGSSMLLTRLLTPDAFGIVGLITAIFFAVALVTDLGFEAFLIRHERTEDRHFRDVVWTIHATRGLMLFIAVALTSPFIAWAFNKPVLTLPLAVASSGFLLHGVTSLSLMTALRQDKSREIALFDFGMQVFQTVTCLLLAWWWRSAWAIIAAMVIQDALRAVLSYLLFAGSSQRPARDRAIAREFRTFSRMVLVSSVMTLLIAQSDKFVLGRLFTLGEFGLYSLAVTIASAPTSFVQSYVRRILFPVYAQTARDAPARLASVYYGVRRFTASLYAFGCGGLMGSAPLMVALLYDPRYASASKFISLLMIATALRLPTVSAGEFLTATGDMGRMAGLAAVRVIWLAIAIPIGLIVFGTMGVVGAVGLIEVPAMLFSWIQLRKIDVLDLREELFFLALVAAGAAIGWAMATASLRLAPHL